MLVAVDFECDPDGLDDVPLLLRRLPSPRSGDATTCRMSHDGEIVYGLVDPAADPGARPAATAAVIVHLPVAELRMVSPVDPHGAGELSLRLLTQLFDALRRDQVERVVADVAASDTQCRALLVRAGFSSQADPGTADTLTRFGRKL